MLYAEIRNLTEQSGNKDCFFKKMFAFSIRTGPTLPSRVTRDRCSVDRSLGYLASGPSLMLVSLPLLRSLCAII